MHLPDRETSLPIVLRRPFSFSQTWLLKAYFNVAHKTFNYRLSRARMTIENSFGRLKGRWRCLQTRLDVDTRFACKDTAACVVLLSIR